MRKDRLAYFKKRLIEKQRQLADEVGRTALYGKDQDDDSIKDLGDQANTAYNREFFFELGNGDRRLLRDVVSALQKLEDGAFGACERCGEAISEKRLEALPFARAPVLAVTVLSSLRTLFSVGFDLKRLFDRYRPSPPGQDDPEAAVLLARADAVRRAGRHQEAGTLYRQLLQTRRSHLGALRGLRDLAAEARQWGEALELQQR